MELLGGINMEQILKYIDQILHIITNPVFASVFTAAVMYGWAKYNPIKILCWIITQFDDRIIDKLSTKDKAKIQKDYDLIIDTVNKVKAD
jgi:hypothetical protein